MTKKIVQEMTSDKDTKRTRRFISNDEEALISTLYIVRFDGMGNRVKLTVEVFDD